jgi:PKD repeat protein
MIQTFTLKFLKGFYGKAMGFMAMLSLGFASFSFGAYTTPNHYYGCEYNSNTRYAAIHEVYVYDANGNSVYSKAGDACNSNPSGWNQQAGHHNVITTSSAFTLSSGSSYSIDLNLTNPRSVTFYSTGVVGIWIDFNGDEDFADAGEFITSSNWDVPCGQNNNSPGSYGTVNFTVPCANFSGETRMRIRSDYYYGDMQAGYHSSTGTQLFYGETEDYTITIKKPTSVNADFFMPDTAFTNTPVRMVNANQVGYRLHEWDINDDGTIESNAVNFTNVFGTAGTYDVRLKSENCLGRDSIAKTVVIVDPTAPPVADFVIDKNIVELYETFQLRDLSTNGPTYWRWFIENGVDTIDGLDQLVLEGGSYTTNQNPVVFSGDYFGAVDLGKWNVCLESSNSIGQSSVVCKKDYIEVAKSSYNMGPETLLPNNVIQNVSGTLYDKGGPSGDYTVPEANLEALIAPCGAESVTVVFDVWKVNSNVNLEIYDGVNVDGKPLHPQGGFNDQNAPDSLVAESGAMYFLWNSTAGGTDEGFVARWTSKAGTGVPPVAGFDIPDTIYNGVAVEFENTSENAKGAVDFEWSISGTAVSSQEELNYTFFTSQTENICLKVSTCVGTDTYCKNVVVADPDTPTEVDFEADNQRPSVGAEVNFTAMTDKANQWEWSFFPSNETYVNGNMNSRDMTVVFSRSGKYTVQLRAWNDQDSARSVNSAIKAQYIIVVEHCTPVIGVTPTADVSISNVEIWTDNNEELLANPSAAGEAYEDFTNDFSTVMNFGATYKVQVDRPTAVNSMSRKIWVDWNIDGDFDDANEMVDMEATANTLSWTAEVKVPDLAESFEGTTRMRIGTSYSTDPNEPCGAASGVKNANRIGEFEDYALVLENDNAIPTLTLNGEDTVYVEVNTTYNDPGAVAMDPKEGDISNRIVLTSDLDLTLNGVYYLTYNVSDASGNAADPITRVVFVVQDQTPPVLTIVGDNPLTIEVFDPVNNIHYPNYQDAGATATDARDGNLNTAIVTTGTVNTGMVGTYEVVYEVRDVQGNTATATRVVNVVDTEDPVIRNSDVEVVGGRNTVNVQLQSVFVDRTNVTDNYYNGTDGPETVMTVTPGQAGPVDTRFKGTYTLTYDAVDGSGNMDQMVIDYVVEDFVAPVIDLRTLDVVRHPVNVPYTPVQATVSDNLYDNTQISLEKTSDVNPFVIGTYSDVYTATDASGNVAVKTRTVEVYDGEAPMITAKSTSVVRVGLYSNFSAVERLLFSDNYDSPADLKANVEVVNSDINTFEEGIYSATFKTTDNSGNESDPFTLIVIVSRSEEPVGVEELGADKFMVIYPNPTNGLVNVAFTGVVDGQVRGGVYNVVGEQVATLTETMNGTYQADLTNQSAGVYFVRVNVNGKLVSKQVVLNR